MVTDTDHEVQYAEVQKRAVGFRHVKVFLLFMAMVLAYMFRVNMSMAVVAMTDESEEHSFDWSMQSKSVILSAFSWGYTVTTFPAGLLAAKFGGKLLVTISIVSNIVILIFLPIAADMGGWQLVCACRVVQGLGQGVQVPALHHLIGKWVPLEEKSRLGSFIYSGAQLGTAVQNVLSGYIIKLWGWPAIFYANAIIGAVWVTLFIIFGSDTPQSSKWISSTERTYIETSLGQVDGNKKYSTPWKMIWTSMAFISLIIANAGQNWGLWTLMTLIPSYLNKVQGVNIAQNGLMSAIPYMGKFIMGFPLGYLADFVLRKKWLNLTSTRKIFNSVGFFGPGIALIGLSYAPADVTIAVTLLTAVVALNAGHYSGYLLGHIDMAPNFAGIMFGITNGVGNVFSIFAPLSAGLLLKDETNAHDWHKVFYLSAGIYIMCNTFYVLFGSSERQKWNEPEEEHKDPEKTENKDSS